MGCIISGKGTKTKWSQRTLCGKITSVQDIKEFFTGKITCAQCLIRQDAMFERGYVQKKYTAWYNAVGRYNMVLYDAFHAVDQYGNRTWRWNSEQIPRNPTFVREILMWDADMVKGAIKLSKIGIHGMGLAK